MEWYDQYSVHIRQMDRQHRQILAVLSRIYSLRENDRRGLERVFSGLENYIRRHFRDEEQLMRCHGYPGYPEQKREHEQFIDQICNYRKELIKGRTPVMINLFNNLWDWLAHHILLLDRRYMPFLRSQGCR